jgi:tubby-related protein 1
VLASLALALSHRFLEPDGDGPPGGGTSSDSSSAEKRFMMSAWRKGGTKNSSYVIAGDLAKDSKFVVGKLKGNWSGASYTVYDSGMDVTKASHQATAPRTELGMVFFEYDRMGPGRMKIALPNPDSDSPFVASEAGIAKSLGSLADVDKLDAPALPDSLSTKLLVCENKRPRWDAEQKGHVLNFRGRVTASSVKNFQLSCASTSGDATIMQFGRVNKNVFTLDYAYPMNAVQAFAVCISSMDSKLADSKGFEMMRKYV